MERRRKIFLLITLSIIVITILGCPLEPEDETPEKSEETQNSEATSPDWSLSPTYGEVELSTGYSPNPYTLTLVAGGSVDLSNIGYYGFVAEAPDFDLYYTAGDSVLSINAECSSEDTIILVSDPVGNWLFDDDTDGLNPEITITDPESGLYDIWVGTVYSGEYPSSLLSIVEE